MESNYPRKNFAGFSQIQLSDENERCGEVFITQSRILIFHCSVCASNFGSYDYFLNHLATHYEDVQGDVIELDTEIEKSNIEQLFEDDSLDKQIEEQDLVKCENDNEYEEILHKVDTKPKFEQIEEVFLEEPYNLSRTNSEQSADEFEELNVKKIKDEIEIEERTMCTQSLDERTSHTKNKRPSRRSDRKSFSCNECGKAFKTNQKLTRHVATHSDERNHLCTICGLTFKESTSLDTHVKRHMGIKTISCGYCSKKFFTTTEARTHRRTHTGERPFVCPTCGAAFSSAGGMQVHQRRHFSERNYKCNFCEKSFYVKAELNDHMLVHTKEKKFVCEICAATFPRQNSWMRHAKMHKKDENII